MGINNLSTLYSASNPVKCKNIKTSFCGKAGVHNSTQHTGLDFKEQSSFLNWFSGFTADTLALKRNYSCLNSINNNELSLVVWGTNLSSQVGNGKFTKLVSSMVNLPNYYYSIVIGLLLSDGWLIYSSKTSKNARLGFKQSIDNVSYALFVFNELSP